MHNIFEIIRRVRKFCGHERRSCQSASNFTMHNIVNFFDNLKNKAKNRGKFCNLLTNPQLKQLQISWKIMSVLSFKDYFVSTQSGGNKVSAMQLNASKFWKKSTWSLLMTPFVSSWIIADAYHLSYISMASSDSQDFISIIIPCHEIEKKILALTFFFSLPRRSDFN